MKKLFRILVITSMLLYAMYWFSSYFSHLWLTAEQLDILSFGGLGRKMTYPLIIDWVIFLAWLLISIGLISFHRSARIQFVVLHIVILASIPFSGLIIFEPVGFFLLSIVNLLDGAIIALSYFSTLSNEFSKNRK